MSLRYAAQKALEALEEYAAEITTTNRGQEAIIALRAGLNEPDWEGEYQACVNRHNETLDDLRLLEQLIVSYRQPVTNRHGKEGDKLAPPFDRSADTGKTSDHIADVSKMVASVREDRTVELGDDEIYDAAHAAYFRGGMPRDAFRLLWANDPAPRFGWDRHDLTDFAKRIASLYTDQLKHQDRYETSISAFDTATIKDCLTVEPVAWMVYTLDGKSAFVTDNPAEFTPEHRALPLYPAPPKREPLTDDETMQLVNETAGHHWCDEAHLQRFRVAIERAHGIGGEE